MTWHGESDRHSEVKNKGKLKDTLREPMASNAETTTTCQICARVCKSKNGRISHHGYKRPNRGSGWQTASCAGARHLPYEVSCDRLPPTIATIKKFIALKETILKEFITNPPEKLSASFGLDHKEVIRPEGFDEKSTSFQFKSMVPFTYENAFENRVYNIEKDIKFAKIDLEFMIERLENWNKAHPTGAPK